jgi:hypothetical protein
MPESPKKAYEGAFELRTAHDLLAKLHHDFARIRLNQCDSYAAFDFFVTADHMIEWLHPGNAGRSAQVSERAVPGRVGILLEVCSHLCNGSKHFHLDNPAHTSVSSAGIRPGAFSSAFSAGFDSAPRLTIVLDGHAAKEFGASVRVVELAKEIFDHWSEHPRLQSPQ